MRRRRRREFADIQTVLTPLIDMGFLLIVFFALVSHIAAVDKAEVKLPRPKPSAAQRPSDQARAIINAVADDSGALRHYRISGRDFAPTPEGLAALGDVLARLLREQETTEFALRADRRIPWRSIAPLFEAASRSAAVSTPGRPARLRLIVEGEPTR